MKSQNPDARSGGRPNRERAAEISVSIVAATIEAFADRGMEFGMDQMAAAAGISKQAVYRRWPGKTDLLIHALDQEVGRLARHAGESLPDDPEAALREMAWRLFEVDTSRSNRIAIFVQAEALREPTLRPHLLRWHQTLHDLLTARLQILLTASGGDPKEAAGLAAILQDLLSGARALLAWTDAPQSAGRAAFERRWRSFMRMLAAAISAPDTPCVDA